MASFATASTSGANGVQTLLMGKLHPAAVHGKWCHIHPLWSAIATCPTTCRRAGQLSQLLDKGAAGPVEGAQASSLN